MTIFNFTSSLLLTVESALNLCGTGIADEILRVVPVVVAVPQVLFCDISDAFSFEFVSNGHQTSLRTRLETLVSNDLLVVEKPVTEEEWLLDGKFSADRTQERSEAAVRAIAVSRNWGIVCEHAYTKAFCLNCSPMITTYSALALIYHWSQATNARPTVVGNMLVESRRSVFYKPQLDDPLYEWWDQVYREV